MDDADLFDGDDDAALRYAIELSLQEAGQSIELPSSKDATATGSIVISSDDEDDDLDRGPRFPSTTPKTQTPGAQSSELKQPAIGPVQTPSGLASLDRKRMEEERLARLGKRKVPNSAESSPAPSQKVKVHHQTTAGQSGSAIPSQGFHPPAAKSSLQYPRGAVKKTWAYGYPRNGDDIKIEEVLRRDELQLAVLSSYQWDEEWLLSKVDVRKTKLLLVAFADNELKKQQIAANAPSSNVRFCFPPMLPYGAMHSKLQLLKYSNSLRIVVPSGNLMPYDWGETGVMENILFLIDLPYITDPKLRSENTLTPFGHDLSCFLEAQGLDQGLVKSLKNYDFSETGRYAFVHSIGQPVNDDRWSKTVKPMADVTSGCCGLGTAVSNLSLGTTTDIEIDYAASSLGALKEDFLRAIYYAAQGDSGMRRHKERAAIAARRLAAPAASSDIKTRFRIYFPSYDTVASSRGGTQSAGTICVQRDWWEAPTFPRGMIRECKSVRPGLLMHSKVMLVRAGDSTPAWAYVGSANISESAWGRLTVDKKTGQKKMTCRNWECGVLVSGTKPSLTARYEKPDLASAFAGIIPVPMKESVDGYGADQDRKPWYYREA
ncbi:tyrosyl-DNA phosphodiesterase-domain-containing protein [Microdochium trichocladiopsis]|uniref:Tyrosyl-DNA phosphodiesterase-domain-containing protein n=1 Tax=Microdochium trichocladiopsis TaxID=1682393 RepID=A0A9P8YFG3_9PEZI|nr:tyrosyl-DNA phosphodiesterase-domain-containing protein [Microdochium trichocladiopsis]KAH7038016.1 tyrosyl-DNA phosphodiesterase-domain-containing protein [Microdochium trichocladiopsis]